MVSNLFDLYYKLVFGLHFYFKDAFKSMQTFHYKCVIGFGAQIQQVNNIWTAAAFFVKYSHRPTDTCAPKNCHIKPSKVSHGSESNPSKMFPLWVTADWSALALPHKRVAHLSDTTHTSICAFRVVGVMRGEYSAAEDSRVKSLHVLCFTGDHTSRYSVKRRSVRVCFSCKLLWLGVSV